MAEREYFRIICGGSTIAVAVAVSLAMALSTDRLSAAAAVVYAFSAWFALAGLGLANPRRFRWALRTAGAVVVLAFAASFVMQLREGPVLESTPARDAAFRNVALVTLAIGALADLYSLSMAFIRLPSGRRASPVPLLGWIFYVMFVVLYPGSFFLNAWSGPWNQALLKFGDLLILTLLHALLNLRAFIPPKDR